jgi:hypothetical protein
MSCSINSLEQKLDNLFGLPRKGIHSYRIYDIAYLDFVSTLVGAIILKMIFFKDTEYIFVFIGLFLLGIIVHRVFNVRTTIDRFLFPGADYV